MRVKGSGCCVVFDVATCTLRETDEAIRGMTLLYRGISLKRAGLAATAKTTRG